MLNGLNYNHFLEKWFLCLISKPTCMPNDLIGEFEKVIGRNLDRENVQHNCTSKLCIRHAFWHGL